MSSMQRTTVMIPADLKARADAWARAQGVSLGELVRDALFKVISSKERPQADSLFADTAVFHGETPFDLARDHDRYLYGDKA